MGRTADITGQRFGRLVAIKPIGNKGKKVGVYWLCQCDCGNNKEVRASRLLQGYTKSCGCLAKETSKKNGRNALLTRNKVHAVQVGQRFGKLVAIKPVDKNIKGNILWECQCDCGNTIIVRADSLRDSNTKSCGCLKRVAGKEIAESILYERVRSFCYDGTYIPRIKSKKLQRNNTSGVTGVHWQPKIAKWVAKIGFRGKRIHLGCFDNLEDAIRARKEAEEKYFQPLIDEYEKKETEENE